MKRTYVDVIGEYYDNQEDLLTQAGQFGLREADLRKVYRYKTNQKKARWSEE